MSAYTGTPPTVTAPVPTTTTAVQHPVASLAHTGIDGGAFAAAVLVGLFVILIGLYLIRKATA